MNYLLVAGYFIVLTVSLFIASRLVRSVRLHKFAAEGAIAGQASGLRIRETAEDARQLVQAQLELELARRSWELRQHQTYVELESAVLEHIYEHVERAIESSLSKLTRSERPTHSRADWFLRSPRPTGYRVVAKGLALESESTLESSRFYALHLDPRRYLWSYHELETAPSLEEELQSLVSSYSDEGTVDDGEED